MKMLNWERGPCWMFRRGIEGLGPDAAKAVALREEVEQLSIRRPTRLTVEPLPVRNRYPVALRHRYPARRRYHKNSAERGGRGLYETDPQAVGRKATASQ